MVKAWPNQTSHTHTIIALEAKKLTENAKHVGHGFEAIARQSYLARSWKRVGIMYIKYQPFGTFYIFTNRIHVVLELFLMEKKKIVERRGTKSKFSCLVFSTLLKVSRVFRVDLFMQSKDMYSVSFFHYSASVFAELLLYLMYRWPF